MLKGSKELYVGIVQQTDNAYPINRCWIVLKNDLHSWLLFYFIVYKLANNQAPEYSGTCVPGL